MFKSTGIKIETSLVCGPCKTWDKLLTLIVYDSRGGGFQSHLPTKFCSHAINLGLHFGALGICCQKKVLHRVAKHFLIGCQGNKVKPR